VVAPAIQGTRARGAFTADERARIAHVLPHISRAIELKDRLALGAEVSAPLMSIADALSLGILLIDARGRVLEASRVAQQILAEADGMFTADGRIAFSRRIDGQAFSCLLTTPYSLDAGAPTLSIPRQRSRFPLSLLVVPVRSATEPWTSATRQWMLVIQVPSELRLPASEDVAHEWRITSAEARVACLLAGGSSVAQIAATLHVSTHTVRTQLKSVYAKTGAASQLEVVRRLLSDAAHRPAAIPP
jgi:DNA-binding CsgD family transcriptional regulator